MNRYALALLILAMMTMPAFSQGSRSDYDRAGSMNQRLQGKVYRASVRPNWLPDGKRFWYQRDLPGNTHEFVLVDPDGKPVQRLAFDHERLAVLLTAVLGKPQTANKLPVAAIQFEDNGTIHLQASGRAFIWDTKADTLKETQDDLGKATPRRPQDVRESGDAGDETGLTFLNQTKETVKLYWQDPEGMRVSYGTIAPGGTATQHTYARHCFLITKLDETPMVVFVATNEPTIAIIDGKEPPAPPSRPDPFVSPNGKLRVILRDNNVFTQDETPNGPRQLTTDGKPDDRYEGAPVWSPDGTKFVLMQTIPAQEHKVYLVESSPKDQLQPKLHPLDYLKPGDRIDHPRPRLFEVKGRTGRQIPISDTLFPTPFETPEVVWEPDGKRFTFLYNQRGHQVMRLIAVDATTGAVSPIIDEQAKTFIDWTGKTYLKPLDKTHEAIWMSERDGWCHLYLYDTTNGTVKNQITKGNWVVRGVDKVDEDKRQIYFRAGGIRPGQDPYYVHYCHVNFDGSGLTILTDGDGNHRVTPSPNGAYIVDTYSRVDSPPVTELRRTSDGTLVAKLETADIAEWKKAGGQLLERFVAKGRDGQTDIYGVIWRPSNFNPKARYPVIEQIYAGPQGAFVPKGFSPFSGAQELAELGFIVVQCDGMGTSYRSKAFHDLCYKNIADAGFPDRIAWIKAAAQQYPQMDITRVGIYGTSAGGQNALGGLLLHGDFYKAGVSDCGCHDNRMDKLWWNEQWMGWPLGPHYDEQSNVTLAPRLTGKLLLMVGEMDSNVDPSSTYQVVNALIKANKDFDFLLAPGVGHGVAGTPYGRRRLQDFFVTNLLGKTPRYEDKPTRTATR